LKRDDINKERKSSMSLIRSRSISQEKNINLIVAKWK